MPADATSVRMAAHDLKEPLRLVKGSLDLLSQRPLDAEGRKLVALATEGVRHMEDVVTRFLDGARAHSRGSAEEALRRALVILEPLAREHAAIVTHDPLPTVEMGEAPLAEAFQNLLANALRHAGPAPRVHVSASRAGAGWRLVVRDSGRGIPVAAAQGVRADGSRGLGLAVTRRLVEEAGGSLSLETAPEGGGVASIFIPGV